MYPPPNAYIDGALWLKRLSRNKKPTVWETWECKECRKSCLNEYNLKTHQAATSHKGRIDYFAESSTGNSGNTGAGMIVDQKEKSS